MGKLLELIKPMTLEFAKSFGKNYRYITIRHSDNAIVGIGIGRHNTIVENNPGEVTVMTINQYEKSKKTWQE